MFLKIATTAAALLMTSDALALSYSFNPSQGQVVFLAKGKPAMIKIKGTGKGVAGTLTEKENALSGVLSFDLATLDTEIDTRNEHMKEKYLEVQKFPKANLHLNDIKIPKGAKSFDFTGEMEIKGVKKPVQGKVTLEENGKTTKVLAEFPIKLSDYPSVGVPSYMGITVAEDVTVTVKADAVKN